MGELPDQMIYGLFIARDHEEVQSSVRVGRGYLTAFLDTEKATENTLQVKGFELCEG